MKAVVERGALLAALDAAAGFCPTRRTIAILETVLVTSDKGQLTIAGTDLERRGTFTAAAEVALPGRVAVHAGRLLAFVKAVPDGPVALEGVAVLTVKAAPAVARAPVLPADDFPHEMTFGDVTLTIDRRQLLGFLASTDFAIESDKGGRYHLKGTYIHAVSGKLTLAATDGHCLAVCRTGIATDVAKGVILPRTDLGGLVDGPVEVALTERLAGFRDSAGNTVVTKLIDGDFPAYERLVTKPKCQATVERRVLIDAVSRVTAFADRRTDGVALVATGDEMLLTAASETGEGDDVIAAAGDAVVTKLGVGLLMPALEAFTGKSVSIGADNPGEAVLLTDPDDDQLVVVVMPMR